MALSSPRRLASLFLLLPVLSAPAAGQAPRFEELYRTVHGFLGTDRIHLVDLDGDGDLDAVSAPLAILVQDEAGIFREETRSRIAGFFGFGPVLAVADFDGDADPDLLVDGWGNLQLDLLLNQGDGTFVSAGFGMPSGLLQTNCTAVGDFDSDGDPDLFLGEWGAPDRLWFNDGSGRFSAGAPSRLPPHLTYTDDVAAQDVDGDGDLDLFLACAGRCRLYRNNGAGHFTDATAGTPTLARKTVVRMEDMDRDGDLDAFLGGVDDHALLQNDGSGTFTDVTADQLPSFGGYASGAAWADFDQDGAMDLYVGLNGWTGSSQDRLFLNDGTGHFRDATGLSLSTGPEPTSALAAGDLDGDRDPDLLSTGIHERLRAALSRMVLNDGSGRLVDVTSMQLPQAMSRTVVLAAGDLDGDGAPDAILGTEPDFRENELRLYRNDGRGTFREHDDGALPLTDVRPRDIGLADLDADGHQDVFLTKAGSDLLWLNDGGAVFLDVTAAKLPPDQDEGVVDLGDVDGDGDPDALIGHSAGARLLLNDGTAGFQDFSATHLPAGLRPVEEVALADFDGDGDLDAFLSGLGGDQLLFNQGTGVFLDVSGTHLPPPGASSDAVEAGDVDGDGDIDVLLLSMSRFRLALNDGSGRFSDAGASVFPPSHPSAHTILLRDGDQDGDLDLAFAGYRDLGWLWNDGLGQFASLDPDGATGWWWPQKLHSLAAEDFDRDGDIDLYCGSESFDQILTNLSRQVSVRSVPRVGQPLVIDLHGPPEGSWRLGAATSEIHQRVPPYGLLRLDPRSTILLRSGRFDADGKASATFHVPGHAALIGQGLYWQALIGPPYRLTHAAATLFTRL